MKDKIQIDNLCFEPFLSEEQIMKRTRLMGVDLSMRYEGKRPLVIGVLNGCFMFMSDLIKQLDFDCDISFIKLASYSGTGQGDLNELIGLNHDLEGRDVIVVEDIVDTGNSLRYTIDAIQRFKPNSIVACTLLLKPDAVLHDFEELTHVGFEIGNEFVIGYGMDYNGLFRNLKDVYRNVST